MSAVFAKRRPWLAPTLLLLLFASLLLPTPAPAAEIPAKGMVTMVDLGAKSCLPCKLMAPILAELTTEYKGRAAIIFIDVWEQPEAAKRFQVSLIPTQIFYDRNGREVYRHAGFMDKQTIVKRLEALLAQK